MRRPRVKLFGPLYAAELARLGRRAMFMALKCVLVLTLLFLIFTLYPHDQFLISMKEQARIMHDMLLAIGGVQLAAVWMLTPWFAAAVLAEEREQKTLDLLLTTTLTDTDLVVGKLAARLTFVGAVILAGFPVFFMLLVFGGISAGTILLIYAGTLLNMIAIGGLSAGCAALTSSYRQSLATTWALLFVGGFCPVFGPAWFIAVCYDDSPDIGAVTLFVLCNVIMGLCGVVIAVKSVRPWENAVVVQRVRRRLPVATPVKTGETKIKPLPRTRRPLPAAPASNPPRLVTADHALPPERVVVPQRVREALPVYSPAERPIGIKADLSWNYPNSRTTGPTARLMLISLFLAACGIGLYCGLARRETDEQGWMATMSMAWIPVALGTCVTIAPTLTREREADTLVMLLTTPNSRTEILWRKIWYRLGPALPFWIITGVIGALAIACTIDHWYWSLAYLALGFGMLVAAVGGGIFLSVYSNTTFLAQAAAIMLMLFAGVMPQWSSLTSMDGRFLNFLPLHIGFLFVAGFGGTASALRSFQKYCPK